MSREALPKMCILGTPVGGKIVALLTWRANFVSSSSRQGATRDLHHPSTSMGTRELSKEFRLQLDSPHSILATACTHDARLKPLTLPPAVTQKDEHDWTSRLFEFAEYHPLTFGTRRVSNTGPVMSKPTETATFALG